MPFYEYRCAECEERFTLMRPISERDDSAECPACGSGGSTREMSVFATGAAGSEASGGACSTGFS